MALPLRISKLLTFSSESNAPPCGTRPPVTPVPAPEMVTGVADFDARCRKAMASASLAGVTISSAWPRNPDASSTSTRLDLEDHRHDQGAARGLFGDEALQIGADLFLHHTPVAHLFGGRRFQRLGHHQARGLDQIGAVVGDGESARHHFGQRLAPAGVLVDGDDGQHDAVLGEMAAVADHYIFHNFVDGAGIDANAAYRHLPALSGAVLVDLESTSGFQN